MQTIVETAVVYVEATNEQQAEEMALESVQCGEPVTDVAWTFKDILGDIEVLNVTEMKTHE